MLTPNASCTLYLQAAPGVYARRFVHACFWQKEDEGVFVMFPVCQPPLPKPMRGTGKERDYLVLGECLAEVTDSVALRALLQAETVYTIQQLTAIDYGTLPHYEVTAQ